MREQQVDAGTSRLPLNRKGNSYLIKWLFDYVTQMQASILFF